jgi:hypothetical protein
MNCGRHSLTIVVMLLLLAGPLAAGSRPSAICRKVRSAVRAGKTVEEITATLGIDTAQLAKCLQQRGRRRAAKKPKAAKERPATPPAPGLVRAH